MDDDADTVFIDTVWESNVIFSPKTLDERACHVFTHGWCHVFALALSAKTNWELWIGLIRGLTHVEDVSDLDNKELLERWNHVVCRANDGLFADVNGFHKTDPQLGGSYMKYFPISKDRLKECIYGGDSSFLLPSETIVKAADKLVSVWLEMKDKHEIR